MVLRAASKRRMKAIFAANRRLADVRGKFAKMALCGRGPDAADNYIVTNSEAGDIAVTRDVPLAYRLAERGVSVLNDRGRVFTKGELRSFMAVRKVWTGVTGRGVRVDKIANYGKKEVKLFADCFDRLLTALAGPAPPNSACKEMSERKRKAETTRKRIAAVYRKLEKEVEMKRLWEIERKRELERTREDESARKLRLEEARRRYEEEAERKREEKEAQRRERKASAKARRKARELARESAEGSEAANEQ